MDKVSIITTCYNCEKYVQYAIESIFKQKLDNNIKIEYIVIDDCSLDNSYNIIKNFSSTNNIEYKIYTLQNNVGCGMARKIGINCASGDYFMFLDADDYYINDDFVNRAVNDIKTTEADIIEYGVYRQDIDNTSHKEEEFINTQDKLKALFINDKIKFNVWSKIYTKKIISSYPYSISRTYEDVRTIPIWIANANKVIVKPSIEINYRNVITSIIRNNDISTRIGTITALTELFEIFKDNKTVLKYIYIRALVDLEAVLANKTSLNKGFDEMSALNTKMLSYLYPDTYKDMTFNVEDEDYDEEE